jgi:hypothetical protein
MSFHELISDYPWMTKRMLRIASMSKGESVSMPTRNIFAWILALFIPRIGAGLGVTNLLIIIAVIGILAAIAIPQYSAYRERAKQASSLSQEYGDSGYGDSEYDSGEE